MIHTSTIPGPLTTRRGNSSRTVHISTFPDTRRTSFWSHLWSCYDDPLEQSTELGEERQFCFMEDFDISEGSFLLRWNDTPKFEQLCQERILHFKADYLVDYPEATDPGSYGIPDSEAVHVEVCLAGMIPWKHLRT